MTKKSEEIKEISLQEINALMNGENCAPIILSCVNKRKEKKKRKVV